MIYCVYPSYTNVSQHHTNFLCTHSQIFLFNNLWSIYNNPLALLVKVVVRFLLINWLFIAGYEMYTLNILKVIDEWCFTIGTIVTWFAKRDHLFWKKSTVKTYQNTVLCTYRCYICKTILYVCKTVFWYVFTVVFSQIRSRIFDRSGPFLQIRSQLFKWINAWHNRSVNINKYLLIIG